MSAFKHTETFLPSAHESVVYLEFLARKIVLYLYILKSDLRLFYRMPGIKNLLPANVFHDVERIIFI